MIDGHPRVWKQRWTAPFSFLIVCLSSFVSSFLFPSFFPFASPCPPPLFPFRPSFLFYRSGSIFTGPRRDAAVGLSPRREREEVWQPFPAAFPPNAVSGCGPKRSGLDFQASDSNHAAPKKKEKKDDNNQNVRRSPPAPLRKQHEVTTSPASDPDLPPHYQEKKQATPQSKLFPTSSLQPEQHG